MSEITDIENKFPHLRNAMNTLKAALQDPTSICFEPDNETDAYIRTALGELREHISELSILE